MILYNLFIIIFFSQATLYFKAEHFKTSIPVAITAMLVMYTLNQSVSKMLPQTSLIKFIDIWICYGLFLHFIILTLLILIEHLPDNSRVSSLQRGEKQIQDKSLKTKTQGFARRTLPFLEAIFVICYFMVAFIVHRGNMS